VPAKKLSNAPRKILYQSEITKLTFTCKVVVAGSSVSAAQQQAESTSFLFPLVHAPTAQSTKEPFRFDQETQYASH
jgi:hypothetical protein